MKKRILIVDDEKDIIEVLTYNLTKEGYDIISANNGKEVLDIDVTKVDLIILDIMLPGMNGYEICKVLKANPLSAKIPIIFLTAKNTELDEILGLEIGAEDYLVKPISIHKLLARIKTIFRRDNSHESLEPVIVIEDLVVDTNNYTVMVNNVEVPFTKKEFESLLFLIRHKGTIVSREKLFSTIWGNDVVVGQRTIDVHIRHIREKLGDKSSLIETIKGVGYRFKK